MRHCDFLLYFIIRLKAFCFAIRFSKKTYVVHFSDQLSKLFEVATVPELCTSSNKFGLLELPVQRGLCQTQ